MGDAPGSRQGRLCLGRPARRRRAPRHGGRRPVWPHQRLHQVLWPRLVPGTGRHRPRNRRRPPRQRHLLGLGPPPFRPSPPLTSLAWRTPAPPPSFFSGGRRWRLETNLSFSSSSAPSLFSRLCSLSSSLV